MENKVLYYGGKAKAGKTQRAISKALEDILEEKRVLFISSEMTRVGIEGRMLPSITGLPLKNMSYNALSIADKILIDERLSWLEKESLCIKYSPQLTPEKLKSIYVEMKAGGVDSIVIDHVCNYDEFTKIAAQISSDGCSVFICYQEAALVNEAN